MGRVRRGSRPFPGKPQGAASPTPREALRRRPSPGYHPRRLPLPPTPAEGSRPLPTDRTIDGCPRNPPGRACPAPTVRRPGNGCPRKPHSVSISPSVGAASPTPRETLRRRQQQPLPSPLGEGGPAGPDEGQAPAAAHSRANRRARRPRRPAKPCAAANNSPCLPPWGKVAPQGRMRGGLPLPPIPGQTVGGGVPDAPRNLPPTAIPWATTRKHPPTQTCGPGMPGPYRAT